MIGATVPQYAGWIVGTAIGAVGGNFIGNPERLVLDVTSQLSSLSCSRKNSAMASRRS
jgi:predicted branched-subunit amino acid permease